MARWASNNQYVDIDFNVSNIYLSGDYPNISFHFDCNFNYYCNRGYASMAYNGVNFHTQVSGYATETKTENVNFYINGGEESPRYGANYYNPGMGNRRQSTVDVHAWISNGVFTGGGWTTVTSPKIGDPSNLRLSITNVTQNSCTVTHSFTNNRNYWYVRLWDRNTRTYYNLNSNTGSGTTVITGLNPNQTYAFELWACGRDGVEYYGSYPAQTITTLGKSFVGNKPAYTIGNSFPLVISGYSDSFTHTATFTIGSYSFSRTSLKRGTITITPSNAENTAIYAQMASVTSKAMSITLTTYVNGTSIGSNTGSGTVNVNSTVCSPSVSSFTYRDVNTQSVALTGNDQIIIQNISKLQVKDIVATAKNSASITKYRLDVSGTTYENTQPLINTETITQNTDMSVKVIDSRGLQGNLNKKFETFIPYISPSITEFTVIRANGVETKSSLSFKGTYSFINISNVNKNDIVSAQYRYKKTTTSTWNDWKAITITIEGQNLIYSNVIGDFNVDESYDFELKVEDKLSATIANTILVVGKPSLSIRKHSVGINKVPQDGYALDIDGNASMNGSLTASSIHAESTISSNAGFYKGSNYIQPMSKVNGYWGFPEIGDYIRTPLSGLIPYQSGGSGYIGTPSWPFNFGYFKELYKNGVSIPNANETPTILVSGAWTSYRFPSGLQIAVYRANISKAFNTWLSGSSAYLYIPTLPGFPQAFSIAPVVHVQGSLNALQDGYISFMYSPTTTLVSTSNANYIGYLMSSNSDLKGQTFTLTLQITAIGRWK